MSIKVTLEFDSEAALVAYFARDTKAPTVTAEKAAKVEAPKPKAEKPAAEPTAPAATAAPAASSAAPEMSADDLTKVIVSTVARTSREAVLGLLADTFGVKAGKEITDPAIRAKAKAALEAL